MCYILVCRKRNQRVSSHVTFSCSSHIQLRNSRTPVSTHVCRGHCLHFWCREGNSLPTPWRPQANQGWGNSEGESKAVASTTGWLARAA